MAKSNNGGKATVQTGAMTLVLLVEKYRSQMIALLLRNGVVVPQGASNQDIALLMVNLLKVSKSFAKDLNAFLANPKVVETVAGGIVQTAQYFKMSGKGYMNAFGNEITIPSSIGYQSQYGLDLGTSSSTDSSSSPASATTTQTPSTSGSSWWSGIKENLGGYLSDGIKLIGTLNTNNANVQIANAQAQIAQANVGATASGGASGGKTPTKDGTSTATIVVLSLVGIAVVGTVIYFATRPKN